MNKAMVLEQQEFQTYQQAQCYMSYLLRGQEFIRHKNLRMCNTFIIYYLMSSQASLYKAKYEEQRKETIKAHNALAILRSEKNLAHLKIQDQEQQIKEQKDKVKDNEAIIKEQAQTIKKNNQEKEQAMKEKQQAISDKLKLEQTIEQLENKAEELQIKLRYYQYLDNSAQQTIKDLKNNYNQLISERNRVGYQRQYSLPRMIEKDAEETRFSFRSNPRLKRPREQWSFEEDYKEQHKKNQQLRKRHNEALAQIALLKYNARTVGSG